MSPQFRPLPPADSRAPAALPCPARAAALDLLQALALPEACNVESWLDRIESRNGRELRP